MHGLRDDLNLFISSELLETILNTGRPTENSTEAATQLIMNKKLRIIKIIKTIKTIRD